MRTIISIAIIFSMIFCGVTYAQQVTVELSKVDPKMRSAIIDAANVNKTEIKDPESWKKWAEVGKSIGLAIGETAKQLNVEVNSFIKTPAGIITIALIVYKIAGKDILRIVLGIPLWCIITLIVGYSFLYFHGRERVVDEKTKEVKYIQKYDWGSRDAKATSAAVHVAIWCLATLILSIIIF